MTYLSTILNTKNKLHCSDPRADAADSLHKAIENYLENQKIKNSILPHYKISDSIIIPHTGESSSGRTCGSGP